eukprot:3437278-Pleurochrysis_carterae.AAC.1
MSAASTNEQRSQYGLNGWREQAWQGSRGQVRARARVRTTDSRREWPHFGAAWPELGAKRGRELLRDLQLEDER